MPEHHVNARCAQLCRYAYIGAITRLAIALVMLAGGASCSTDLTSNEVQLSDIREVTFRWLFVNYDSTARDHPPAVFFLEMEHGVDPPPKFLERFAHHVPPVRVRSAATYHADFGVVDNHAGERGMILRTEAIRWISDVEIQVDDSFSESGLGGGGYTHTLKRINGKWVVTKVIGRYAV